MKQGEIWWANLPKPVGRRPVLLLSRNEAYKIRSSVTVAIVTTTIRSIASEVLLGPGEGLPKACVANLDTIITIEKASLHIQICVLTNNKWKEVIAALKFALDFI
jgi:mRNA interferase MazF